MLDRCSGSFLSTSVTFFRIMAVIPWKGGYTCEIALSASLWDVWLWELLYRRWYVSSCIHIFSFGLYLPRSCSSWRRIAVLPFQLFCLCFSFELWILVFYIINFHSTHLILWNNIVYNIYGIPFCGWRGYCYKVIGIKSIKETTFLRLHIASTLCHFMT